MTETLHGVHSKYENWKKKFNYSSKRRQFFTETGHALLANQVLGALPKTVIGVGGFSELGASSIDFYQFCHQNDITLPNILKFAYYLEPVRQKESPAFSLRLDSIPTTGQRAFWGGGDSLMAGTEGKSPLILAQETLVGNGYLCDVPCMTADDGQTCSDFTETQLRSDKVEVYLDKHPMIDALFISVGGNDMKNNIANSQQKVQMLENLARNPLSLGHLLNVIHEAESGIPEFRENFSHLLDEVNRLYYGRVRYLVFNALPDIEKADALIAQPDKTKPPQYFPIKDPNPIIDRIKRRIVAHLKGDTNAVIIDEINKRLAVAGADGAQHIPIAIIDNSQLTRGDFGRNIHPNFHGYLKIAMNMLGRTRFDISKFDIGKIIHS